jgi:signal transduction histidine kinase
MQSTGWPGTPTQERKGNVRDVPGGPAAEETPAGRRRLIARIGGRYEDFLRSTVDWLWETDAGFTLTYASSPVALKLGIPAQVLVGRPMLSLGVFEAAGSAGRQAPDAIAARRPFRGAVFVMAGAEDREVAYRLSGVPYFDEDDGRFAGYRGTAVAVPREAPAAAPAPVTPEELEALAALLEETLVERQEAAWRLSQAGPRPAPEPTPEPEAKPAAAPEPAQPLERTAHELRTPLNAIVGYADLALQEVFGPLNERYADCFRSIREAGRHLDQIVAHLQDGGAELDPASLATEVVEIAAVVAKAKAMIALAARNADVDISRIGPMAGGRVVGDRVACTQVLVNLLGNAVRYTPAGGSVGLETLAGPENTLQIVVWDTGAGIPPEAQAKIFEPRYRVKTAAHEGIPGHGLGLAISRDLARAMGGDLTVASQPGQGSRFILSLPLAAAPEPGAEEA